MARKTRRIAPTAVRPLQSVRREPNPARNIAPTVSRRYSGQDHLHPTSKHAQGSYAGLWHGTKRVLDPARRRAKNKRSWERLQREARCGVAPAVDELAAVVAAAAEVGK